MPKTWKPGEEKRFARELVLGRTYYTVVNIATNMAPYEDSKLYSEYVFTKRMPITGTPCTEGGFSAVTLLRQFGPIHDTPPRGMRNIADRAPQVPDPVGNVDDYARLDEVELRGLGKRVRDGSNPINRPRRGGVGWRG
jgi:hypothetical protein